MVLSAVIIALIMLSLGAVISSIETQTFEPSETEHYLNYIENEAEKIYEGGTPNRTQEENFRSIVSELDYTNNIDYGSDHVNVTLTRPGERYELQRLGE